LSNPQIEMFERLIREKRPTHASPEDAARAVRRDAESLGVAFTTDMQANLDAACAAVRASEENVEILRRCSIIKVRDEWYRGPSPDDRHWPALHGYMKNTKGWAEDSIRSMDETSGEVVSLLANPAGAQFTCRGLVVGYVQSGKTANMTAVIAKAVDAGYNLIVLLGGITNKLRAQTQRRIEADIVDRHRHLWQLYTTVEDNGDFTQPANRSFTMPVAGRAQLAVMKKITSRLRSFHRTIERTPPAVLRALKVLLIDDECDQASVNSAKDDYDITKINEAIRKIIRLLPAVSYVGYTATPFANVFIDPFPHNREELDDLYPEDFITSLPLPQEYFGTRSVFGADPMDAGSETEQEAGRDMIRQVPDEELALLCVRKAADKDSFVPEITGSLESAILWFLASCSVRRLRGQAGSHMTMLVHTSAYVAQHRRMAEALRSWIVANRMDLRSGSGEISRRFNSLLEHEFERVPAPAGTRAVHPAEVVSEVGHVLDALEISIENGVSEERLDYNGEPKTYIVVGGAVLARGLTLEGLCVSFFLRTAKQYDTLLQMGRWFGYRHGYEDLPRLWTTVDLAANFRALARIEEEIREDIEIYRQKKLTPKEFAVRVRAIPGMAITSATKMRHAYRTSISYEGRHVQTIRFDHRDYDTVAGNWKAASRLLEEIGKPGENADGRSNPLWREVPADAIRKFLVAYRISDHHMDLKKDLLLGFFDGARERMPLWNIGIVGARAGSLSARPLGPLGTVPLVRRAQLRGGEQAYADIKALMSKRDILIDAPDAKGSAEGDKWDDLKKVRPPVPLLLLYPIDAKSAPRSEDGSRMALDAVGDLMGIGIVFPGETDRSGDYYQVELDSPTPEQLDAEEVVEELDEAGAELVNG